MNHVGIVGAGAWGTSLAIRLHEAENRVTLWALEPEVVESISAKHENTLYLKGVKLPSSIQATSRLSQMEKMEALFMVTPAQFLRSTLKKLEALSDSVPLVLCGKGVETDSLKLMSEVAAEITPNPLAVLSGPTFADEVAKGLPVSATLACVDDVLRSKLEKMIHSRNFKIFPTDDIIGAQLCGAVKNVIAIAAGLVEGRGLGENAKAALITQGLREIKALCVVKGGRLETMLEPCGMGDLILTCGSVKSRNMSLGYALGQSKSLQEILMERKGVTEGVASSKSVMALAQKLKVKMPVCNAVYNMLHEDMSVEKTIEALLSAS